VRGTGDYYDSSIRRGYKMSVAARRASPSPTDRGLRGTHGSKRWGKSAVFDTEDYGREVQPRLFPRRPNGSLYLGGEVPQGRRRSRARASRSSSIDIADVFTPDDAFPPGYFAYRFESKTWIGHARIHRPLGPRDAIDISVAAMPQSTPTTKPELRDPGPFRYDVNQYSITYLMRF
jgi:hypothetical protein